MRWETLTGMRRTPCCLGLETFLARSQIVPLDAIISPSEAVRSVINRLVGLGGAYLLPSFAVYPLRGIVYLGSGGLMRSPKAGEVPLHYFGDPDPSRASMVITTR